MSDSWECFFESLNIGRLECFVVEKTGVQKCSSREFGNFKLASTKLLIMSKVILKSQDRRDGVMTLFDFDGWLHFAPTITQLLLETLPALAHRMMVDHFFYFAAL